MGAGMRNFATLLSHDADTAQGLMALMKPSNGLSVNSLASGLRALRLVLYFDPLLTDDTGAEAEAARAAAMELMINNKSPAHTHKSSHDQFNEYARQETIEVGIKVSHQLYGHGQVTQVETTLFGSQTITVEFEEPFFDGNRQQHVAVFPQTEWSELSTVGVLDQLQTKHAELGAAEMILEMMSHPTDEVRTATLRYCNSLMEPKGHLGVQNALIAQMRAEKQSVFPNALKNALRAAQKELQVYPRPRHLIQSRHPNLSPLSSGGLIGGFGRRLSPWRWLHQARIGVQRQRL